MEFQNSIYGKKIPYMELKFHIWNFQMDDFIVCGLKWLKQIESKISFHVIFHQFFFLLKSLVKMFDRSDTY